MRRAHIPILRGFGRLRLDHLVIILIYAGIVVSSFIFYCMYMYACSEEGAPRSLCTCTQSTNL